MKCNAIARTVHRACQRIDRIEIIQHAIRDPRCHDDDVLEISSYTTNLDFERKNLIAEVHTYTGDVKVNFKHVLKGVYYSNAEQQQQILDKIKSAVADSFDTHGPSKEVTTWIWKLNALTAELGNLQRKGLVS